MAPNSLVSTADRPYKGSELFRHFVTAYRSDHSGQIVGDWEVNFWVARYSGVVRPSVFGLFWRVSLVGAYKAGVWISPLALWC
jgi:hypothetical protein